MGEIQALSEILMGDLPSQSVFSLEPVFMCNSSLKQTSEEGNRDIVGSWVVAFFFFFKGEGGHNCGFVLFFNSYWKFVFLYLLYMFILFFFFLKLILLI